MNYIHIKKTYASLYLAQMADEALLPEEVCENNLTEDERDSGSPDPHDDADFGLDQAAQQHLALPNWQMERWIRWQLSF